MASPRVLPPYLFLLTLFSLLHSAISLQVTPGSPCAALCMDQEDGDPYSPDSSTTNATDIVCQDSLYSDSKEGAKFKSCMECLQKSDKTNGTEADNYWLLYNLRHSLGTCLYGFDDEKKVINSPCIISWACEPLEEAILSGGLDPDGDDPFGYCSAGNGSLFGSTLRSCVNCLKSSDDEAYLGNCKFLTNSPSMPHCTSKCQETYSLTYSPVMVALQVGCSQEPEPGVALGISGSPFTRGNLKVTTGSSEDEDADPGASPNSLTTGAIVGIAVGIALFVFGGAALWFVYRRKKRNSAASPALWGGDGGAPSPMVRPGKPWMGGEVRSAASSRASERSEDEKGSGGRKITGGRINELRGYEHSRSDSLSSLPAHPAYIPRAASRNNTPTPPQSRNPFQTPTPPRGPSPASGGSPPRRPARQTGTADFVVPPPPPESNETAVPNFVLPPPPPRAAKVPTLSIPTPKGRAAKKSTPPTIVIDPPADTRSPKFVKVTE